jgi:regulator of sirC expression with transglutaminase-like and TPR domain
MPQSQAEALFAQLLAHEENEIDLAEAALLIAQSEYASLDLPAELARLDQLAAQIEIDTNAPALSHILALNQFLFGEMKFTRNDEEYDDPDNSYLNRVLDRKMGLPITLSLVYTEVARRLGLPIIGVGFPGHFMVKYLAPSGEILIDPYHQGAIPTPEDCRAVLEAHFGKNAELKPEYFQASTKKQILARMLNNLKGSYHRRRNFSKVLLMISLALSIDPASGQDLRDRGMVYLAMKKYREAIASFEAYLQLSPQGDPEAQEVLRVIHRIRAQMN